MRAGVEALARPGKPGGGERGDRGVEGGLHREGDEGALGGPVDPGRRRAGAEELGELRERVIAIAARAAAELGDPGPSLFAGGGGEVSESALSRATRSATSSWVRAWRRRSARRWWRAWDLLGSLQLRNSFVSHTLTGSSSTPSSSAEHPLIAAAELAEATGDVPAQLPRHRHALPRDTVRASQIVRILLATAEVVAERGYAATSVAQIVKRAGVSTRTFYEISPTRRRRSWRPTRRSTS